MNVIFDLDGILIDSFGDIEDCLKRAFEKVGVNFARALDRTMIGPPLMNLVASLAPQATDDTRASIVKEFRKLYDASDYPFTRPMEGVQELLETLWQKDIRTFIATNKAHVASQRIVKRLGWTSFKDLIATDSLVGRRLEKSEMLKVLGQRWALTPAETWMVGDSASDVTSAHANGFHAVAYESGYGDPVLLRESRPEFSFSHCNQFMSGLGTPDACSAAH